MTHLTVLALFIIVVARDLVGGAGGMGTSADLPLVRGLSPLAIILGSVIPFLIISVSVHLAVRSLGRLIDRTGAHGAVMMAGQITAASRVIIVLAQGWAVFGLGWLDLVRAWIGDSPGIDEILATLPAIGAMAAGWSAYYTIDRRVHEAGVLGSLDRGEPVPRLVSRGAYVVEQLRHNVLFILVPVCLMLAWWEGLMMLAFWSADRWSWARAAVEAGWPITVIHFSGVVVLAMLMPLVLRWVWRTDQLGAGALRDRLVALGEAHKVRFRDVLVWRTHQDIANGAVIGIVAPARYVLLTETLLDRLPLDRIEAVMAHEVGHARRRHIPWLMGAMIAALTLAFDGAGLLAHFLTPKGAQEGVIDGAAVFIVGAAASIAIFGFVSRRFELQADAFAAQHLSGYRPGHTPSQTAPPIAPEAADSMIDALGIVARLNHANPRRFTLRHGSIRWRQNHLANLVGLRADRLPIDRTVVVMKWAILVGLAGVVALAILGG